MKKTSFLLFLSTAFLFNTLQANAQDASWRGKPFILTTGSSDSATNSGLSDQFNYELEDETLVFTAQDISGNFALIQSTGGSAERLLDNTTLVASAPFQNLGNRLFQREGSNPSDALVVQAEVNGVAGYYQRVGSGWERVLQESDLMPGQSFGYDQLGEPHSGNGKVAYLGINNAEGYRGVYIRDLDTNAVTTIADSTTLLPGIGSFDLSSSQVGFDGDSIAFWGIHQETASTTISGIYFKSPNEALQAVAVTGDTIPGTGVVMDSFQSPPAVADGQVAFVAFDASFNRYLLHWDGATVRLVAKEGDTLPEGGTLTDIVFYPPVMSGDTIAFGAKLDGEEAVIEDTAGTLALVLKKSALRFYSSGSFLSLFTPVDIEGDTIAIEARSGAFVRVFVNQGSPPKPFISDSIGNETLIVDSGDSVTFTPEVFGQGPLTYSWTSNGEVLSTDPSLTIPSFTDANYPFVDVSVTSAGGTASKRYLVTIDGPPVIYITPEAVGGYEGIRLTASVFVSSPYAVSYQWQKTGANLPEQTGRFLDLTSPTSADSGSYRVIVTNEKGSTTSGEIEVTVLPVPDNPSFAGAVYEDLFTEPADEPTSVPTISPFFYSATGNLRYFTTTSATSGLLEIDQTGAVSVIKTLAEIATDLGLSAIVSFQNINETPDGKVYFTATQSSPFKQVIGVLDANTANPIFASGDAFPDLPGQTPTSITLVGLVKEQAVIGLFDGVVGSYRYYRLNGETPDLFFDPSSTLTDGTTTSSATAYLVIRAVESGVLVYEYPTSASALFDRIWQIDDLTGATSIVYDGPLDFDGTEVALTLSNPLGSDGTAFYTRIVGGVVALSSDGASLFQAPESAGYQFVDGQLFAIAPTAIYRHEGANEWLKVYDTPFHNGAQLQRLTSWVKILAAQGDSIAFSAQNSDNQTVYITNRLGDGGPSLPSTIEIDYDPTAGTYVITVPPGLELWKSTTLVSDSWTKVADAGRYLIEPDLTLIPRAFYRLQVPID